MKHILQFCLLLLSCYTYGQERSYHREHVTDENGFLQNTSYGIAINQLGYAWVLSEYGLSRFDGANIKNYLNTNYFHTSNKKFSYLLWNQHGNTYACDDTAGNLVQLGIHPDALKTHDFVTSDFQQIVFFSELKNAGDHSVIESLKKNKHFYLTNAGDGYVFNEQAIHYFSGPVSEHIPFPDYLQAIPVGEHILVIQKNYRVSILYKGKELEENDASNPSFSDSLKDASITVNATGTFVIRNNQLYQILFHDHLPYLNLMTGLLNIQDISAVCWDANQKIIWVSSSTDGVYVFKQQQFRVVTSSLNYPFINNFYSQVELKNGTILSAYSIVDSNGVISSQNKIKSLYTGAWIGDSTDHVYFSDNNTLYKADSHLSTIQKVIPLSGSAYSLLFQHDTLWLADRRQIGYLWQDHFFKFYPTHDSDPLLPVTTILSRFANKTWIGTMDGLYLFTPGSSTPVSIPELKNKRISCITSCAPHTLFIGTKGQGCFLYKDEGFKALPMDKSHALNTVNAAIADRNGFLWISTNRGLLKARINELENYFDKKTEDVFYYYYYKEDGFATNEFNNASASPVLIKKNGLFSFSSLKGLVWFNPYLLPPGNFPATLIIDEISIDDSLILSDSRIELPSSYSNFTIKLSVPYWGNRNNLEVSYMLSDTDAKWHLLDNQNSIDFTKLSKGSYKLLIKVRTGFGDSDVVTKQLNFAVLPAWYETNGFRFFLILLILLVTYGVFRLRLAGIQREKKILDEMVKDKTSELKSTIQKLSDTVDELTESQDELHKVVEQKEKIASILAHDLRTPLKFMTMLSEYLNKNFDSLPPEKIQHLTSELMNSSKGTFTFAEELMTWLSMQKNPRIIFYEENIKQIIEEICIYFSDIAGSQKTKLIPLTEEDLFAKTDERLLRIILRNLVDNAIKHTVNGTITINAVNTAGGELRIEIKDTGKGMSAEQLREINMDNTYGFSFEIKERLGFQIIKDFTLKLKGRVEVESELSKGTTVILRFPL